MRRLEPATQCVTPGNSGGRAVTEATEQVERITRLAYAIEAVCMEILIRLDWLERDVATLKKRGDA